MAEAKRICSIPGCEKYAKARGWCSMHYKRWQLDGSPGESSPRVTKCDGPCSVLGCDEPVHRREWCSKHYQRWLKHGDPSVDRRTREPVQCSVDGCERKSVAKGLCQKHWSRLARHGTTDLPPRRPRPLKEDLESRFWRKVDKSASGVGCWLWTGGVFGNGYGRISVTRPAPRNLMAHRVAWEICRGSIPEGLELDHLCRNRLCVNPDHLEPVTRAENMRRALPWRGPSPQLLKTHCPHGHPYSDENTHIDKRGARVCRTCKREQRWKART